MTKLATDSKLLPHFKRKIKCPCHYVLKPGCDGYVKEPNSLNGKFSAGDLREFKLKNWRYKRDKRGQKIPKWDEYHQPEITAAFAIEHVYDPLNPICKYQCKGRCLEGQGNLAWQSVKRLK